MEATSLENAARAASAHRKQREVSAVAGAVLLPARLLVPSRTRGIVVLTNSCGEPHHGTQVLTLASALCEAGWAVLAVDVLTAGEAQDDVRSDSLRNDIPIIARRIAGITDWLAFHPDTHHLAVGYLGIGAAASEAMLVAAAERSARVRAVVVYDGRPDLVTDTLRKTTAPILAILGEDELPLAKRIGDSLKEASGATDAVQVAADARSAQRGTHDKRWPARVTPLAIDWYGRYLPLAVAAP